MLALSSKSVSGPKKIFEKRIKSQGLAAKQFVPLR
jgi:hypothetical protein